MNMFEQIKADACENEIEKISKEKPDKMKGEYLYPGDKWRSESGMLRALAEDPKKAQTTMLKSGLVGAGIGVLPSAAAAALLAKKFKVPIGETAIIGGLMGAYTGLGIGAMHGQNKYYRSKGIKLSPFSMRHGFDPNARKYLD